jgi:stage III sporulation protein AB
VLRLAAAGLIGISCFMTGMMLVMRMRARIKLIEAWQTALRQIEECMCERLMTVDEALAAYKGADRCKVWLNALMAADDMRLAWELLIKNARTTPLMPEELEALTQVMPELGALDMERQRAAFAQARRSLDACAGHARDDLSKNARVYTTLGSLGGMLAAILII